ncbi:MAG: hypothetical protein GWN99_06540 [Gemmatimonadetes bacterium]|uniref:Uncharacterized protein n=1 Tax=Candidatus Kutchimonas denitrificans TaxID=3056748 RepID=A0AAE4Z4M4_9BACT|nr:hypothetical protein [Gemmatimonadota bacterium]NIR73670.1 hypothetical protein [Candidatus Kutchimonas denitrificans]NIS00720.1 hypothetical protein [Gemmatimonadota bacterium]NIT66307.1 hypothetical protein [Gemmatimonadota bacterium]NIU51525.1 hypothetical protein [Gemmatimonadota bacterium]
MSDSLFWVGTGESFTIDGYERDGSLALKVEFAGHESRTVSEADLQRWAEQAVATVDAAMAEHMRPFFEGVEPPSVLPPYDRMLTDSDGNLWVERYRKPDDDQHTWTVFAEDGVMLGHVNVPAGFEILDIGPNYVLGRRLDDLDIEHVQLYSLMKG